MFFKVLAAFFGSVIAYFTANFDAEITIAMILLPSAAMMTLLLLDQDK